MRMFICLGPLAVVAVADVARATDPLPVIVTYELSRGHEARMVERRDPEGSWIRRITARLEERKPAGIIGLREPATAQVSFTVGRGGEIVSKTIAKSSGVPAVDKEAIAMLERAQPFPPMPAAMNETSVSFSLPLRFR